MNLRVVIVSAACLYILCIAPASGTSLLAAAAAVKGAIIGAGLTALKTSGGSETVVIQSEPGSIAEVVPSSHITVQNLAHKPLSAQTITYTSGNPISRLIGAVSSAISTKAKAIGDFFRPNRVVIVVPNTITTTPKPMPVFTIDLGHKPMPAIDIELGNKPLQLPSIDIGLDNKPLQLPSIDIGLGNKPLQLPSIDIELGNKPLALPGIGIELGSTPLVLPSLDVQLDSKPIGLPSLAFELDAKPLILPNIGVSASVGRGIIYRRIQPVLTNYLKK